MWNISIDVKLVPAEFSSVERSLVSFRGTIHVVWAMVQRSGTVHADITADHRDVPAMFLLMRQGAKPRIPKSNFAKFTF